jgi:hypothetical protein
VTQAQALAIAFALIAWAAFAAVLISRICDTRWRAKYNALGKQYRDLECRLVEQRSAIERAGYEAKIVPPQPESVRLAKLR